MSITPMAPLGGSNSQQTTNDFASRSHAHPDFTRSEHTDNNERLRRIHQVFPDIASTLEYHTKLLERQLEQHEKQRAEMVDAFRKLHERLDQHDNAQGAAQGALQSVRTIVAQFDKVAPRNVPNTTPAMQQPLPRFEPPSHSTPANLFTTPQPQVARPALVEYQSPYSASEAPITLDHFMSEARSFSEKDNVPQYMLRRDIRTVHDLWQEYTEGIGGSPSVQSLNERHGPRWRSASKEAVFYSLRKVLYEEIQRLGDETYGGNAEMAVHELDQRMVENKWSSLSRLATVIKQERAARRAAAGSQHMPEVLPEPSPGRTADPTAVTVPDFTPDSTSDSMSDSMPDIKAEMRQPT